MGKLKILTALLLAAALTACGDDSQDQENGSRNQYTV